MFPSTGFPMPGGMQCGTGIMPASAGGVSPFGTQGLSSNGVTQMNATQPACCGGSPQGPQTCCGQPSQGAAQPGQPGQGAQGAGQPMDMQNMMFQMMGMMMTMMMGMLTMMMGMLASGQLGGGQPGGLNPATGSGVQSPSPGGSPGTTSGSPAGSPAPANGSAPVGNNPVNTSGSSLPLPKQFVKSPVTGLNFGADRDGGSRRHHGNDFMAPKGTPIFALMGGTVVDVKTGTTAGKMVTIQMANGDFTKYLHMDAWQVEKGQTVNAGQQIGTVGDTGTSPGNTHLHFEYHKGSRDNPIDPWPILQPLLG